MKIYFGINNEIITLSWDNDLLSERLTPLFRHWQVNNADSSSENPIIIRVTSLSSGYQVASPHNPSQFCHDELTLFSLIEYSLTLLAVDIFHNFSLFHAASLDLNGAGALIVGDHGSGKTTLALTAASSGFNVLSDEIGIVNNDNRTVVGFPRPFHVLSDTLNMEPSVVPQQMPSYTMSEDVTYLFFDNYYVPETMLKYIFFPVRGSNETTMRHVGETESLRLILPRLFNFTGNPDYCIEDIIKIIRYAAPMEIAYKDHWDAIKTIRHILAERR